MSIEENTFNSEEDTSNNEEGYTSAEEEEEEEAKTYSYNDVEYDNLDDLLDAMSTHREEMIKSCENLEPLKKLDDTVDDFTKVAKATFFQTHIMPKVDAIAIELSKVKVYLAEGLLQTNNLLGNYGFLISEIRPEVEKHAGELDKIAKSGRADPAVKSTTPESSNPQNIKNICEVRGDNTAYFSHRMNKATKEIENNCDCPDGFVPYHTVFKGKLIENRGCVEKACDYSDSQVTFSGESGHCMQTDTIAEISA